MPYGRRGGRMVPPQQRSTSRCSSIRNPRARQACIRRQEAVDRTADREQQYGDSRRNRSNRVRSRFGRRFRR